MRWAAVGLAAALAWPAGAQEPPKLDPAGVRGVRNFLRMEARGVATTLHGTSILDWSAVGIVPPVEQVTPAQIRGAFEGNAIQAERRFARPFIVVGALHSVIRRPDRQVVVRFVDGGLASSQRRALAELRAYAQRPEPDDFLSGATGGVVYAGATAVLPTAHEDAVADWRPGQNASLHCRGASNVPLAVKLADCTPQSVVSAEADRLADVQSALALAGEPLTVPAKRDDGTTADPMRASSRLLWFGYSVGVLARDCTEADATAWSKCAGRVLDQRHPKGRAEAVRQQVVRDFGKPEAEVPPLDLAAPTQRPPSAARK